MPDEGLVVSGTIDALHDEVERLQARVRELETALGDAIECVESWAAYATDYFREKHDLAGDLARLRAALAAVGTETPEGHTRMTDGITPSEPTEWLEDLNAVSAEKEDDDGK